MSSTDGGEQLDRSVFNLHVAISFFAALTFYECFSYLVVSPVWIRLALLLFGRTNDAAGSSAVFKIDLEAKPVGVEAKDEKEAKQSYNTNGYDGQRTNVDDQEQEKDTPITKLTLSMLFTIASLAQFVSSFAFTPSNASAASVCTFLVAWFDIHFQSARIVGLCSIGIQLRKLGWKRAEMGVFVTGLLGLIGAIIANIVLSFGKVGHKQDICYRKHSLAPSIATSVFAISIESLCIIWIFRYLQVATGSRRQCRLAKDFRVKRITALLLFDFICLVPNSIKSVSTSSFIPFSVAALVVLIAFNRLDQVDVTLGFRTSPAGIASRYVQPSPVPSDEPLETPSIVDCTNTVMSRFTDSTLFVRSPTVTPSRKTTVKAEYGVDKGIASSSIRSLNQVITPRLVITQATETGSIREEDRSQPSLAQSLTRPIIPMEVITKHFSDNEQKHREPVGLPPRPAARISPPRVEAPILPKPQEDGSSSKAKSVTSAKRHSFSGESGFAPTLASSIYGSDIIRPPSGAKVRDRMKIPEFPRLPAQVTGVPYTTSSSSDNSQTRLIDSRKGFRPSPSRSIRAPNPPPVVAAVAKAKAKTTMRNRSGSTESNGSWKSDQLPSRIPSLKFLPHFNLAGLEEKWPMPPTRVPTPEEVARLNAERRRKRQSKSRSRGAKPGNSSSSSSVPPATPRRRPPPKGGIPTRPSRRPEALYF